MEQSPSVNAEQTLPDDIQAGQWPRRRSAILDWLLVGTRHVQYMDDIFLLLCGKLHEAGLPLGRVTLHLRTLHPQWLGVRFLWQPGMEKPKFDTFGHGIEKTAQYLMSPIHALYQGVDLVRQRLDDPSARLGRWYQLYDELIAEGLTDYVAWPLEHTFGKRQVVTFSCNRKGGFSADEIAFLTDLLPVLALVSEIRMKNRLARTLLETYVGPHASEQILAGATTRGSGATVGAAILVCDMRDFTTISDHWPRDDVIERLNAYFDALSGPIERHGGEILKFMGDGLLAIFPLSDPDAGPKLLAAIAEARLALAELDVACRDKGQPALAYGIGVHVGDVMYGNIGSRQRLDFTVIGPAVNVTARLEALTKELGRPILLSGAFVDMADCRDRVEWLGSHPLRGLGEPVDVFAYPREDIVLPTR
ncbi:MAG: adenylate/guanylate cyclase domain-containing protein [Rhizobiales bacterium]|nr:adenylate/guanylate cyclase domain-containing protein [Hyphomicrobiales bacterium]